MRAKQSTMTTVDTLQGPFGQARHRQSLSAEHIAAMYELKCGYDVRGCFPTGSIDLYECLKTGYRFWRPTEVAGDEQFYRGLSAAWPTYYRDWRWEYQHLPGQVKASDTLLEVGSGRGYFLRFIEDKVKSAVGLELNTEAVAQKVCRSDVLPMMVEELAASAARKFDVVCSFQVLEHIPEPDTFLRACIDCLAPSGQLILSTPNSDHIPFQRQEDAFDLPPHHLGHFSPKVFAELAKLYDVQLERVLIEPRQFSLAPAAARISESFACRAMRYLIKSLGQAMYDLSREPGASVLVVLRKRASNTLQSK